MDMNNLDLAADAEKGATFSVRHPVTDELLTGSDEKPLTIQVHGVDSATFKRAVQDINQAASGRKKVSPAEQERQTVNALARATIGWSDNWVWGGEPFKFSPENCRKLYAERAWLRAQVDEFIADRSRFFAQA